MARLLVVGNAHVEIGVPPHRPPDPGEATSIDLIDLEVGGEGAHTAIHAARLGVSTSFAGVLGQDTFGLLLRDRLVGERVDVTRLQMLEGRASPVSIATRHVKAPSSELRHEGTHADYRLPAITPRVPCGIFHLAAPEVLSGMWPGGMVELARQLKVERRTVTLDPRVEGGGRETLRSIAREHQHLLEFVDIAFPDEREACAISDRREIRSVANYFHERGVTTVVIKRARNGVVVSHQGRIELIPSSPTEPACQRGAGAAFVAAYLAGHLRGLEPLACARLGCRVGALTVRFPSPLSGTAMPEKVEEITGECLVQS